MPKLNSLLGFFKKYGNGNKPLYIVSLMIFFFAIFDGIISYITPIAITDFGISESLMGIIIGFSSFAGLFFDIFLCRIFKNMNFLRMFFLMFLACLFYPLLIWQANSVAVFLLAMALWGLYYDLFHFGSFDFVGNKVRKKDHAHGFGIISVFQALGYILGPLFAVLLIENFIDASIYIAAWLFLGMSFLFFLILLITLKNKNKKKTNKEFGEKLVLFKELLLLKKLGKIILPVLILTFMLNVIDAFFWTIGPLLSESILATSSLGGLFILAYQLPSILVGWFVGAITAKLGKKRTAFYVLLLGSLLFCLFFFVGNPVLLIAITFAASFFISLAWPAINGSYANYISETPKVEKEINSLQDSLVNLGYIIGPVAAGFISQYLGHLQAFAYLGVLGVVISLVLIKITPKKINIKI